MTTADDLASATTGARPADRPWLVLCAAAGVLAGLLVVVDSLAVDAWGNDAVGPNLTGVVAPAVGILGITGLRVAASRRRAGWVLDLAWALNVIGLALVVAIDLTRTLVLSRLDDDVLAALLADGPTRPGLFLAAIVYIVGTVAFGLALVARRFSSLAAWAYVLTAAPSGLVVLLPELVGALIQAVAGIAVAGLSLGLLAELRRHPQR